MSTPQHPPFRTARLQFDPLLDKHADGMHALRALPEVMKWSMRKVPDADVAATQAWMEAFTGVHAPPRVGYVVRVLEDGNEGKDEVVGGWVLRMPGRIIGSIGLRYEEVGLVRGGRAWELGYIFHPDVWGKGYATEAVRGLLGVWEGVYEGLQWEGKERGEVGPAVAAVTDTGNEGSKNVLRKCGFRELGEETDELGTVCLIYGLDLGV
ncbi:GNAT family N-acetyltransferase [Aspergillus clavatus NRRL 1]|uniref:GNAT family acetyltransferase, putative n=1 Tax=Aspergillus clavatus (strain ATCC 1007 / CBS 513.65 / DSM 816 / NCTC 3887 / NRRL 1 / QM 1276 / 107) TaxID=344612 RepID=A1CNE7_ASPCL|nr:GNAT family acetyltransferase, putative [Aspergillus clavatus NRRL 1]EAW07168.1 GNAT family acetyltransferase, putative [Aspergillus clavatus NRRL 1]